MCTQSPAKLLRALVAVALLSSADMAEVVRAGLQAMPKGQYEAAHAPGLSYWQTLRLIMLLHALKVTIPNIVNSYIALFRCFKDTTLVFFVGIFDFLTTVEVARAIPGGRRRSRAPPGIYLRPWFISSAVTPCRDMRPALRRGCRQETGDEHERALGARRLRGGDHRSAQMVRRISRARRYQSQGWPGERIVICGPSGSGKSTLLRCINRLEDFQRGDIVVDGMVLTRDVRRVEAIRREVAMVFQHFNLFPHLTVLENCTLAPIQVKRTLKRESARCSFSSG